jgi:PAS domain S-box-containing protein
MVALLLATAQTARSDGLSGLRIAGEMTWALNPAISSQELIEFEARYDEVAPSTGVRAICQYDRRRFAPEVIRDVLRTHPIAIVGDRVHDNPYYEPATLVLDAAGVEARRVDWMLDQIQRRTQRFVALADLGSWALERVAEADLMNAAAHLIELELHVPFVEVFDFHTLDEAVRRVASVGFELARPTFIQLAAQDVWIDSGDLPRGQLLIPDWSQESRIARRPELQARGIVSSAAGPVVNCDGEELYGVVWVHSSMPRIFSHDELAFLETVAMVLAQATARRRAEEQFQTIADNGHDALARFDRDSRHVFVNLAYERLMGVSASDLIGKTCQEAGVPDLPASTLELIMGQVWRSGHEQVAELNFPTPSGERHLEMRITPELRPAGSVQSLWTITRDLTEQREAEAERAELYREIVAQQSRLSDHIVRLEQDRAHGLQRAERAVQAEHLTPREREVVQRLAKGWTNPEIARDLQLTAGTVKNHVATILTKLDVTDRTQAAVRVVELGIALPD